MLSTPISQAREQPNYDDSDDEQSSLISEPGSPPDIAMNSDDDEDLDDFPAESFEDGFVAPRRLSQQQNAQALRSTMPRVATPMLPPPGSSPRSHSPTQLRNSILQHIRSRHPQEYLSSDHFDVPSLVDESEVPTAPSAAEAAGSQLSMLSVSDVDMDAVDPIPTTAICSAARTEAEPSHAFLHHHHNNNADDESYELERESAITDREPMDQGPDLLVNRKQRQRSGALSNRHQYSPATVTNLPKRGFSMGFRADCEKCRLRVPGHMNHFII